MTLHRITFMRGGAVVGRQYAPTKAEAQTMATAWRAAEPYQRGFKRESVDTPKTKGEWLNLLNGEIRAGIVAGLGG